MTMKDGYDPKDPENFFNAKWLVLKVSRQSVKTLDTWVLHKSDIPKLRHIIHNAYEELSPNQAEIMAAELELLISRILLMNEVK